MPYIDDFLYGIDLSDTAFDPEHPFKDISDYIRLAHIQPELLPANRIKTIPAGERNGRMKNYLMASEKYAKAVEMLNQAKRQKDALLRCRGLAAFLEGMYLTQGYGHMDESVNRAVIAAIGELDKQVKVIAAVGPSGRPIQGFHGTPLEYLLKSTSHFLLEFQMFSKVAGALPEVIKDCYKVLRRVDGVSEDDPQVVHMLQAVTQAPELQAQLPEGLNMLLQLSIGPYTLKMSQVRWLLHHACCIAAKHMEDTQQFEAEAALLVKEAPDSAISAFLLAEAAMLKWTSTGNNGTQALRLMRRVIQVASEQGDDIAGALAAWNAAQLLVSGAGGSTFAEAELAELVSKAGEFKTSLKRWGGIMLVGDRLRCVGRNVRQVLRAARRAGYVGEGGMLRVPRHVPGQQAVQPGQLLQAPQPRARRHCDQCGLLFDELRQCSQCRVATYCGRECQRKHWKVHKKVCAELAQQQQQQ